MKIINCGWLVNATFGSWPIDGQPPDDLPLSMRRRLSSLGRQTLQVLNTCTKGLNSKLIPWVVSCRHGDIGRRLNLLSNLVQEEMLSPTDFSMSVHNAIIGVFSIATGNKHTHSALAAGPNSFEAGLLESVALLKEKGGSVGYIYYDYIVTDELSDRINDDGQVECFAMVLSNDTEGTVLVEYSIVKNAMASNDVAVNSFSINKLLCFFKNNEKKFTVPVGGGEILFARTF